MVLPAKATVRITGFARSLDVFASVQAYLAANVGRPQSAAEAFLPMGLLAAAANDTTSRPLIPSSTAIITGRVSDCARLRNEETGQFFHWLLVDCLGTRFDIVADPELMQGDLQTGATVEAACWLAGRILE